MCGKLNLPTTLPDDIYFIIGKDRSTVVSNICPYMVTENILIHCIMIL